MTASNASNEITASVMVTGACHDGTASFSSRSMSVVLAPLPGSKLVPRLTPLPSTPTPLQHSAMPPTTQVVTREPCRPRLLKIARTASPAAKRISMTAPNTAAPTGKVFAVDDSAPAEASSNARAVAPMTVNPITAVTTCTAATRYSRYDDTVTVVGRVRSPGACAYG